MELDAVLLARIQFAFTVSFHIIFPSFTIGLAAFIATLLIRWRMTGREHLHRLARFWTKIFAVSFAMGVVSGIVMSYEFGTNWANFSVVVGNVLGPLLGYEVLTAFFLEATFLGIMLFGWQRVPAGLHVLSAILVAIGTSLSAFWILAANSWMQTPAGHEVQGGIAYPLDWIAVIFNPSFPYRFAHMFTAAYLTTSLVVLAVGARYLLKGRFPEEAKTMMRMGLGMVAILAPLQALIGDQHGLNTLQYQPEKIAAIESHWDGSKPGALVLFAIPNEDEERNELEVSIPGGASWFLTHSADGLFPGLKQFPRENRPPVFPVFLGFRVMVGLGLLMILLGFVGRGCGRGGGSLRRSGTCRLRSTPGPWASSPFLPAGTSPRSAASRGSPPASCAPPMRRLPSPSPPCSWASSSSCWSTASCSPWASTTSTA
jgi:cytochrome d ubiquinol oxidase subunit I